MKKLWFGAIAAALLLTGTAANAGDHRDRGHGKYDRHEQYRHSGHYRGHHDKHHRHHAYHPHSYRPAPVHKHYVHYYPQPVYYERDHRSRNDVSGSITVRF